MTLAEFKTLRVGSIVKFDNDVTMVILSDLNGVMHGLSVLPHYMYDSAYDSAIGPSNRKWWTVVEI